MILSRVLPSYRHPVCDALAARGFEVHAVLAGDPEDEVPSAPPADGAKWHCHDLRRRGRAWRGDVVRRVAAIAPDVILMEHGASLDFVWTVLCARRLAAYPRYIWTHGVERRARMGKGRRAGRAGRWIQLRLADGIVTYDSAGAEIVRRAFPRKPVFVAPNSTDGGAILARRRQLEQDGVAAHRRRLGLSLDFYLLGLGRLIREKRFDRLVAIVRDLRGRGIPAGAILVGDGPERSRLAERTREAGLAEGTDIVLAGQVDDPRQLADWMYVSDVAVLPGYVGLAAVDCMFGGLPLVSSRPGRKGPYHAPEWFLAQASGLELCVEGSDEAAYAEVIAKFLSRSRASRAEHSEACVRYAREHFGVEPLIEGLEMALDAARTRRAASPSGS